MKRDLIVAHHVRGMRGCDPEAAEDDAEHREAVAVARSPRRMPGGVQDVAAGMVERRRAGVNAAFADFGDALKDLLRA